MVIPLRLEAGGSAVSRLLPTEDRKHALRRAFAANTFTAHKSFLGRRLTSDESVDVSLADLYRL